MRLSLKILLPVIFSGALLTWGVIGNRNVDVDREEKYETPSQNPETFTISEYQRLHVKEGFEWSWANGKYRVRKSSNIYGILKFEDGDWRRSGRWYFFNEKKLIKSTSFSKGEKDGNELFYNKYGFLKTQRAYKAGILHGISATYNSEGNLSEVSCFEGGEEVDCVPFVPCEKSDRDWESRVVIENQ